jgi:hypothetical protein
MQNEESLSNIRNKPNWCVLVSELPDSLFARVTHVCIFYRHVIKNLQR